MSYNYFSENNIALVYNRYQYFGEVEEQPIVEFCRTHGLNERFLASVIHAFEEPNNFPKKELSEHSTETILDYLEKTHAYYLNKLLPEIEQTLMQLITSIGSFNIIPLEVLSKIQLYNTDLKEHIREEETLLFPYIKELLNFRKTGDYSICNFVHNHKHNEGVLGDIKSYIRSVIPTEAAILPYHILMKKIDLLENDLRVHAMIEDEILVEKAFRLEQSL